MLLLRGSKDIRPTSVINNSILSGVISTRCPLTWSLTMPDPPIALTVRSAAAHRFMTSRASSRVASIYNLVCDVFGVEVADWYAERYNWKRPRADQMEVRKVQPQPEPT